MFRSAMVGALLGAVGGCVGGCVPGAIEPRRGGAGGATGGAIGRETITVRDGSDEDLRAAVAGTGGSAVRPADAGRGSGGSAMTSELPAADAGRSSGRDDAAAAFADAHPSGDATRDGPVTRAPRLGELAIDEVLVNPTGDDLGREWIELANRSGDWLDLSGLHLANASVDVAVAGGAEDRRRMHHVFFSIRPEIHVPGRAPPRSGLRGYGCPAPRNAAPGFRRTAPSAGLSKIPPAISRSRRNRN